MEWGSRHCSCAQGGWTVFIFAACAECAVSDQQARPKCVREGFRAGVGTRALCAALGGAVRTWSRWSAPWGCRLLTFTSGTAAQRPLVVVALQAATKNAASYRTHAPLVARCHGCRLFGACAVCAGPGAAGRCELYVGAEAWLRDPSTAATRSRQHRETRTRPSQIRRAARYAATVK